MSTTKTPRTWQRIVNNGTLYVEDTCREDLQRDLLAAQAEVARLNELNHGAALALHAHGVNPSASSEAVAIETASVLRYENDRLKSEVAALREERAKLVEQTQQDNDACKKLSGFTFEELSWEFERLKNNLLNTSQQIEDANHIIGLFYEACSEKNVGLFHERLGAAFEKSKEYRNNAARKEGA